MTADDTDPKEATSFTSWKMDLFDAISMEASLSPMTRLVAFRLLQHANSNTRAIFPSQERIALQVGVRPRRVRECISELVTKGWLLKSRRDRRVTNSYEFLTGHVNEVLDRQSSLNEGRHKKRTRG